MDEDRRSAPPGRSIEPSRGAESEREEQDPLPAFEGSDATDREKEILGQILGATTSLDARLLQLSEIVQSRLAYDKAKEEAFDRLYAELEPLKSNAAFEQLRPLFFDLILLFDRIENICQSTQQISHQDGNALSLFRSLSDELVEILYRREIEVIPSSSSAFDPSTQRAIGLEPTASERETGRIAKIVRRGFRYRNRIIRAEEVIVKKFAATGTS
jgi:molecular chaperone GrpE